MKTVCFDRFRQLIIPKKAFSMLMCDVKENGNTSESSDGSREQVREILRKANLLSEPKFNLPKTEISDERRKELAEIFSAEKPLGDYIDEDREARG